MNWFDFLFVAILGVFAIVGWNRGLIRAIFLLVRIIVCGVLARAFSEILSKQILKIPLVKSFLEKSPYLIVLIFTGIVFFIVLFLLLSKLEKPLLRKIYSIEKIRKKPMKVIGLIVSSIAAVLVMGFFIIGILSAIKPTESNLLWSSIRSSAASTFIPDKLISMNISRKMNKNLLRDLSDPYVDLIEITADISLIDELIIDRPVIIDGSSGDISGDIIIKSTGVALKNITIDGAVVIDISSQGGSTIIDNSIISNGTEFYGKEAGFVALKNNTELHNSSYIYSKSFNMNIDKSSKVSGLVCREKDIQIKGEGTIEVLESVLAPTTVSEKINVIVNVEAEEGEFLIKFLDSVSEKKIKEFMKQNLLEILDEIDQVDAYMVRMNAKDYVSGFNNIKDNNLISYIESNYHYDLMSETSTDVQFSELLWGLSNRGQEINGTKGINGVDIDLPDAWDVTRGKDDIVVAVIDTGTDINHPDLADNIWTNPKETLNGIDDDGNGYVDDIHGWDFLNNDNMVYDNPNHDLHGTHCSGTIASSGNNSEVYGVAPNIKILPLKFLGEKTTTLSSILGAINYCKSMGIKISNNSWGGGGRSEALREAIKDSGMLFICAAGNDTLNLDVTEFYPASYRLPNMISVAAVDNQGALGSFSNYGGNTVDVGAPGVDIYSTAPNNGYQYLSGTSMATPHVTGIAALITSNGVDNVEEIKRIILSSAQKNPIISLSNSTTTGGIVNAAVSLGVLKEDGYIEDILPPAPPVIKEGNPIDPSLITEGKYVEFGSYLGQPIMWQIINKEDNGLLIFSKDILSLKAFDANGDKTDGRDHLFKHRIRNGSNYWEKSNIREWLNSNQNKVSYSHLSPKSIRLAWSKGGYAQEPGFLNSFSTDEQNLILPVRHKSILAHVDRKISTREGGSELLQFDKDIGKAGANYNNAYFTFVTDKVFLLSLEELQRHVYQKGFSVEGYLTAAAMAQTDILDAKHDISEQYIYWLRTPLAGSGNSTYYVDQKLMLNHAPAYGGNLGLRPAAYISYEAIRFGDGSLEDPYRLSKERKEAVDVPVKSDTSDKKSDVSAISALYSKVPAGWGNTSVNLINGGNIGKENGHIYYLAYPENKITRIKPDGSKRETLSGAYTNATAINVYNGDVYFAGESSIEIVKSNGKSTKIEDLCHSSKKGDPCSLFVKDNWIYYSIGSSDSRSRIYKIKTDGSNRTKLEQLPRKELSASPLVYTEDAIFYLAKSEGNNTSVIYRLDYDAKGLPQEYGGYNYSNSKRLVEIESSVLFNVFGERIYYVTDNFDSIYSIRTDGSDKKQIIQVGDYSLFNLYSGFSTYSTLLCEVDEWLYINIIDKGICRVKIDGSKEMEVIVPKNYAMAIFDDRLYFPNIETKYSTDLLGKDRIDLK